MSEPSRATIFGAAARGAVMLLLLASGAAADPPSTVLSAPIAPSDEPSSKDVKALPQVTIVAPQQSIERRAYAFVRRITHSTRFYDESLERWNVPLCFLVSGLPRSQGEFVLNRLADIAESVGARLDTQQCHPNFYVFITANSDSTLNNLRARYPQLFADKYNEMPATTTEMKRFLHTSRPVRVWYNTVVSSREHIPLTADPDPQYLGLASNRLAVASRLVRSDVIDLSSVVIIVDISRAKGVQFGQMADYIGMVGLTELDIDADVGNTPTILRLFTSSQETPPSGLTAWDQAFLKALYHTDQSSRLQESNIAMRIVHDISP